MSFNIIRKFIVDFPERFENLKLTKQEIKVFAYIRKATRADPRKSTDILPEASIQHRSAVLHSLWKKGYLERRSVIAKSGGYEFEYWPVEDLSHND